jgi:CheY-like chemotaxis protein
MAPIESQSRVLIVDDEPGMCWALENILRPDGYQTVAATTGQEALELTQEKSLSKPFELAKFRLVVKTAVSGP